MSKLTPFEHNASLPLEAQAFQAKERELLEQQERKKVEAGRYTLEEVANLLAENSSSNYEQVLLDMVELVNNGELPVYEPNSTMKYRPKRVRTFYEEVYWDDLNKWIIEKHPKTMYRFPAPSNSVTDEAAPITQADIANVSKPLMQQRYQENEILRVIGELGISATKMPPLKTGKSGVKAQVRGKLGFPIKVFDKAWERLRADGRIKEE